MEISYLYVIVKLVERCNLNCSYCYYFTTDNSEVYSRAPIMSEATFNDVVAYVKRAVAEHTVLRVVFGFHGGEPTLAKPRNVRRFCEIARNELTNLVEVGFTMQTNAVHISPAWMELIRDERITIGISIDGAKEVHDRYRVDHFGKGSYERTVTTLTALKRIMDEENLVLTALAVMGEDFNGTDSYRHMVHELGVRNLKLLLPDRTNDDDATSADLRELGRKLCEVFDYWLLNDRDRVSVILFEHIIMRTVGASRPQTKGAPRWLQVGFAALSDGRVRIQDDFMVASKWFWSQKELSFAGSSFDEYLTQPHMTELMHGLTTAPKACAGCEFEHSCGGGEIAHRYSRSNGFENKSVYCETLMILHKHIAQRIELGRRYGEQKLAMAV